jgi:VIT1/CCC1 family predicted Fe2+/Mn2+ transporter
VVKTTNFSYGATAGIVTSLALIVGLDAATATEAAIVSGLLIVALADNLTDALSIHIFQESERLEAREAFRTTLTNVGTRLFISLTFVLVVVLLPMASALVVSVIWGLSLIVALTYILARERKVSVTIEIAKHVSVALVIILVSRAIGVWILAHLH